MIWCDMICETLRNCKVEGSLNQNTNQGHFRDLDLSEIDHLTLPYLTLLYLTVTCFFMRFRCENTTLHNDAQYNIGVLILIDMFQSCMRTLTAIRSSVLTAGESEESSSRTGDAQTALVFETIEVLLLLSGSVITPSMREEIELCVGQGTLHMFVTFFNSIFSITQSVKLRKKHIHMSLSLSLFLSLSFSHPLALSLCLCVCLSLTHSFYFSLSISVTHCSH